MVIQPVGAMLYAFSRYSNLLNVLQSVARWFNSNINVLSNFGVAAGEDDGKPHLVLAMDYYKPIITPNPVLTPPNIVIADEYVSPFTFDGMNANMWTVHFKFRNDGPIAATNIKLQHLGIIAPSRGKIVDTCSSLPRNTLNVNQSCEISGLQSMTASQVSVILTSDEGNHVESTTLVDHYSSTNLPTAARTAPVRRIEPIYINQLILSTNQAKFDVSYDQARTRNLVDNSVRGLSNFLNTTTNKTLYEAFLFVRGNTIGRINAGKNNQRNVKALMQVTKGLVQLDVTLKNSLGDAIKAKITGDKYIYNHRPGCSAYGSQYFAWNSRESSCDVLRDTKFYLWLNEDENEGIKPGTTYTGEIELDLRINQLSKLIFPLTIPITVDLLRIP